eukprot:8273433-Alexandrium_andersonii.AAC.1
MSASLVGSEMCIRDRSSCRCAARCLMNLRGVCLEQRSHIGSIERVHAPVSYTHLTLPTICSV